MSVSTPPTTTQDDGRRHAGGPPLGILAVVSAALFVASIVLGAIVTGRGAPTPDTGAAAILSYVTGHPGALRAVALLQLGSAVPLAIYAATVSTRLRGLGVRVPGPTIALSGGLIAAAFLALSALVGWVQSRLGAGADHGLVLALRDLGFITGGPGVVVFLGLLLAGVAVPALLRSLTPRWLAWCGLALAVVAELSFLSVAIPSLYPLLAIGRFGGDLWLIAVGILLPARASALRRRRGAGTSASTAGIMAALPH